MEKAFVFSQDQKDQIWTCFVEPAGGTEEEFLLFLEVCESAGLSPLLKEIRFEKQEKMPASFLPTREGLLRTAASHPDFIGMPCAADIREGDVFQMYAGEGSVRHAKRLARNSITQESISFGDETYSKEELVAEIGAAILCGVAGIERSTIENSASYIQSWLRALKEDNTLVVKAAGQTQKAADYLQGLNGHE